MIGDQSVQPIWLHGCVALLLRAGAQVQQQAYAVSAVAAGKAVSMPCCWPRGLSGASQQYKSLTLVDSLLAGTASSLARTTQLNLVNEQLQRYGQSFEQLTVQVTPETASRLHVKVSPTGQQRWEVSESIVPRCAWYWHAADRAAAGSSWQLAKFANHLDFGFSDRLDWYAFVHSVVLLHFYKLLWAKQPLHVWLSAPCVSD
jgi:hypothetical protein